jgi:NAD(P)-dependent dehydrogenase (short-subunit alcohol dehydrogenase family)
MQHLDNDSEALVVGAGGGIGGALVNRLLQDTPVKRVWAASRTPRQTSLAALAQAHGERLAPIHVDVADPDSIEALGEALKADGVRLHLLINAFGFLHDAELGIWPEKRLEDINAEGMGQNFRLNTLAPALVVRHCFDRLNHGERAVIANLSARVGSISDNRLGGWYAYRASKAAQNMFTRGLAIECARRARRVICLALHPGTTDTGLSEPFQARVPSDKLFSPDYAAGQLLARIDGATEADSGAFLAWDGQPIAW